MSEENMEKSTGEERQMTQEEMLELKLKTSEARMLKLKEAAQKMKDDLSTKVDKMAAENVKLRADAEAATKSNVVAKTFETQEVVNLIKIRDYIALTPNNFALPKDAINALNKMLILVDKKIVKELLSDDFKKSVNFADAQSAMNAARKLSDIKSGLTENKNTRSVVVDDNGKIVSQKTNENQ